MAAPSGAIDPRTDSRWPALLAVIAVAGLRLAMPDSLGVGPDWLHMAIVGLVLALTVVTHREGKEELNQALGYLLAGVLTLFLVWSLVLLVDAAAGQKENPVTMLRSAAALWASNVLVFAYWYWRIDGGGPHRRELHAAHPSRAFLFQQMTLDGQSQWWVPRFVDYLFVSFCTSTAFSPADAVVLTRTAKVLTMVQAAISLTVVAVLAARAVNIF